MKTKNTVWTVVVIWIGMCSNLYAQDVKTNVKGSIEPYPIGVPFDKTVNLLFPYSIKSVDRGNSGVLVQKANGVENVSQLKAAEKDFTATNLTVIAGEGAFYSVNLHFDNDQPKVNLKVAEMVLPIHQEVLFSSGLDNEATLYDVAKQIAVKKKSIRGVADNRFDMSMSINGIYIIGDVLYFQINLENSSLINYDTDQFRIYIRDKRKAKRTASQEIELSPLYIEGNVSRVAGQSSNSVVVALDKFTIPDKKFLMVELMERNGGRNLKVKIKNKVLIKAKGL